MRSLIPSKRQWKNWSLPSKLTAIGTLLAVLSFGFYLLEKAYPFLQRIQEMVVSNNVQITVEFQNISNEEIQLYGRGEVYYWFPGGSGHKIYALEIEEFDGNKNVGDIVLRGNTALRGVVNLLPANVAKGYLKQGHMSVSLVFNVKGGGVVFGPSVGFTRSNLKNTYIPVEFGESAPAPSTPDIQEGKYTFHLTKVVSDASSIKILNGCVRLGGSYRTSTEVSEDICNSKKQIDGAFADSVKYIESSECARAIIYSDANFQGLEEDFNPC